MIARAVVGLLNTAPSGVARRFPPNSRAARLLKPLADRLVPQHAAAVNVRRGLVADARMLINARHEKYYWTGVHEVEVQEALSSLLEPGNTCWDIGAHAGFFTILASRAVGPEGQVHSFEPSSDTAARLEWAIAENSLDNARLHRIALAGEDGDATLFSRGSSLMATLVPTGSSVGSTTVPCRTIDSLAAELRIPDVIKVDVEGLELDVLAGGAATFAAGQTKALVELASPARESEALRLLPGYAARRISSSNWLFTPNVSQRRGRT